MTINIKMGLSNYAFVINNIDQLKHVLTVINEHNHCKNFDEVGEEIDFIYFLKFQNKCFMVACNGGGRDSTHQWFNKKLPTSIKWYPSLDKPKGYYECKDFIWAQPDNPQESTKKLLKYEIPKEITDFLQNLNK